MWGQQLDLAVADTAERWQSAGEAAEAPGAAWAWHGEAGQRAGWAPPRCVSRSAAKARPGYDSCDASEYLDSPAVLDAKLDVLAGLILASRHFVAYTGAGLSTSAGIADYASHGEATLAGRWQDEARLQQAHLRSTGPTVAHLALAALARPGSQPADADGGAPVPAPPLKAWVNQNHDGLGLKAACPPRVMNEVHGAWYDPRNPVVQMSGALREDLCERMRRAARAADLVLAAGTSLCGLYADQVATDVARRHHAGEDGVLGLVIINLQKTMQDARAPASGGGGGGGGGSGRDSGRAVAGSPSQQQQQPPPPSPNCALRIFATLDVALGLLARKLRLSLPTEHDVRHASAAHDAACLEHGWYHWMYEPGNRHTTRETESEMRRRCGYPQTLQPLVKRGVAALSAQMLGLHRRGPPSPDVADPVSQSGHAAVEA